jgi:hypothetical protein
MDFCEEEKRTSSSKKAPLGDECCQRKSSRMTVVMDLCMTGRSSSGYPEGSIHS